mmetsp:Transcript_38786/g.56994  ORF Transcript_38786/g.56994 Transcript_38786/m.56994 type:complete len:538 (+) Transcript_38786:41-1654(+)
MRASTLVRARCSLQTFASRRRITGSLALLYVSATCNTIAFAMSTGAIPMRNDLAARCPPVSADKIQEMASLASAWGGANGLQVLRPTGIEVAPVSLRPMPFPRAVYTHVWDIMTDFNELVHKVSLDSEFLNEQLLPVAKTDEFQRRLLEIYNACREEGIAQPLTLGVHRSDYMLHDAGDGTALAPKQVEINTVAASFAGLSQRVTAMHQMLLGRVPLQGLKAADCPENAPISGIAAAIAKAISLYTQTQPQVEKNGGEEEEEGRRVACLFVVQPNEQNVFDQRHLEFELWGTHKVAVVRATLADIHAASQLDETSRVLTFQGFEIGVIYFRAGYAPPDFTCDNDWAARLRMERSAAVKCPSAAYQCVGAKKIQQVLARPGMVEKYLSAEAATRVRSSFAGLYGLGDGSKEADDAKRRAIANPSEFVLKPQREGGGNNHYDMEMVEILEKSSDEQLAAYILMDIIKAPPAPALFMRQNQAIETEATTELGVYGVCIANNDKILLSKPVGHLLRSKMASSKETGVAAGFGVLDSPVLFD